MVQKRTEFSAALQSVAAERGLDPDVVLETIKQAILAAFRRDLRERGESWSEEQLSNLEVEINQNTGEARVFLVDKDKKKDVTPPGFGRIAAQTAKQVILQKIREAEKEAIFSSYRERIGTLVTGVVMRFDGSDVRVDLGRTEGIMPARERIPNEKLNLNQRLAFLLKEIKKEARGEEIILSRADPEIVKKLFAREVPEIASGAVEIKALARIPGVRTKIAVASSQPGIDPVGSCVGQKGVRVQTVSNELNNEKIDAIPWTDDVREFIGLSLAPADDVEVEIIDEKKKQARARVPESQLSLAIGSEGQNVKLASQLTGWHIEVEADKKGKSTSSNEDNDKNTTKANKTEKEVKRQHLEPKQ